MAKNDAYRDYITHFVHEFLGPYGIQKPGRAWNTQDKSLPDGVIKGHLEKIHWVGVRASWYPPWGYIDLDSVNEREGLLERVTDRLKLDSNQYLVCTSPSWKESGNLHVILAPRMNGKPPTKKRLYHTLERVLKGLAVEVYPQENRIFRLPFGRDQFIYDPKDGVPLVYYSWQEALDFAKQLDDFPLEALPIQMELPLIYRPKSMERWARRGEAEELLSQGLQGPSTRHDACLLLAIYLYRSNLDPGQAVGLLRNWIREKHNGQSKEICRGNVALVDREIDDLVRWTYSKYGCLSIYPDSTHNMHGWVTGSDIKMIADMFPGDIVNQKRLFRLMLYYRPRQSHDWTFIPKRQWEQVAHPRSYKDFEALLVQRGFLEIQHSYLAGGYPKRFRLHVGNINHEAMLEEDGRAIQEYPTACLKLFNSKQAIKEALGISRKTAYNLMKRLV